MPWCRNGQEEVRRLAALTGETCQFCMPVGNKYAVVSMQDSARLFRIGSDIGVLVPIPWTASGRLFVSHMTPAELNAFIPPEDFRAPDGRMIDPAAFLAEGKSARQRGICIVSGLVDDFATCLAAPVLEPGGRCIACICFIVSSSLAQKRMRELSQLLMESGRRLSGMDGGRIGWTHLLFARPRPRGDPSPSRTQGQQRAAAAINFMHSHPAARPSRGKSRVPAWSMIAGMGTRLSRRHCAIGTPLPTRWLNNPRE